MSIKNADTLRVPGAHLYYEVRGSGPVLVLSAGGAGDADSYNRLVEYLVDQYTVVTFDRRGYARSPLDDPDQPIGIETHGGDIHHLLTALTSEPAYVFGCSIGALIALDLVIHHADQVRILVAHEPPIPALLPDMERPNENLQELAQREGGAEALKKFAASLGVNRDRPNSNLGLPQANAQRAESNRAAFLKHDAGAVERYLLNITALKASSTHVVPGGGREGKQYFPYRCAEALAERLGTTIVDFPGNHAGFVDYPKEFAETLCKVLSD
jgi:pimeloyl-ACP methyl ester carboxylesterase